MIRNYRVMASVLGLLFATTCLPSFAVNWLPFGPDGGDARSFAADPKDHAHLYLGTATGWIYESFNGGAAWKRLAWIGNRDDLALDNIVVDSSNPKHLLVGAWVLGSPDGGLYSSKDGGQTWSSNMDMSGQSIRALTADSSNPKIVVAGTLKGVYQSIDGGDKWKLISPSGSQELHEVESIAIDPVDPQIIYAGTWHLPWKTTDGGEHWTNIKQGIIDDSDVFSIILDPKESIVVYASACSGIYKSVDSGEKFQKVQGIPSTARRTRVLMQDPQNRNIVFAGTTEGLFRTVDSGATWLRTTGAELIINDVFIDPSNTNRVLLATDRGGVMASNDGGISFSASNAGFSARQITSYIADATAPSTIYIGVVNDKAWGGVFVSVNGGLTWTQKSSGLNGHDVFSLEQAADGTVLAGTRHGIYRLQGEIWHRVDDVTVVETPKVRSARRSRQGISHVSAATANSASSKAADMGPKSAKVSHREGQPFDASIISLARSGGMLYAATSEGILRSLTEGASWKYVPGFDKQSWNFVSSEKSIVLAASLRIAVLSLDNGEHWTKMNLPPMVEQVTALVVDGNGGLWIGGRQGIFFSEDNGVTWQTLKNLYVQDVNSLFYDEPTQRILITTNSKNRIAFAVHLPERTVSYWNTGWNLKLVRTMGDHLIGATLFDGIVVQPRMVDSKQTAAR